MYGMTFMGDIIHGLYNVSADEAQGIAALFPDIVTLWINR